MALRALRTRSMHSEILGRVRTDQLSDAWISSNARAEKLVHRERNLDAGIETPSTSSTGIAVKPERAAPSYSSRCRSRGRFGRRSSLAKCRPAVAWVGLLTRELERLAFSSIQPEGTGRINNGNQEGWTFVKNTHSQRRGRSGFTPGSLFVRPSRTYESRGRAPKPE